MREQYTLGIVLGIALGIVVYGILDIMGVDEKPLPRAYLVTCYSGGQVIFERDGMLDGNTLDCGDRKYILPANCLLEELK